jgi:hypothetical protein
MGHLRYQRGTKPSGLGSRSDRCFAWEAVVSLGLPLPQGSGPLIGRNRRSMHDSFELRGDPEGCLCGLDGVCQAFNRATLPRLEEQRSTPVERQLRSNR